MSLLSSLLVHFSLFPFYSISGICWLLSGHHRILTAIPLPVSSYYNDNNIIMTKVRYICLLLSFIHSFPYISTLLPTLNTNWLTHYNLPHLFTSPIFIHLSLKITPQESVFPRYPSSPPPPACPQRSQLRWTSAWCNSWKGCRWWILPMRRVWRGYRLP